MNPGDTVQEANRSGPDEATGFGAAASVGNTTLADSPRTHETLQDIQDIIDKLAAVTQQLRRPRQPDRGAPDHGAPGAVESAGKAAQ